MCWFDERPAGGCVRRRTHGHGNAFHLPRNTGKYSCDGEAWIDGYYVPAFGLEGVLLLKVIPSTNELRVWSKCRSTVHVLEHVVFDNCLVFFMHTAMYLQCRSTWTSRSHCWVIAESLLVELFSGAGQGGGGVVVAGGWSGLCCVILAPIWGVGGWCGPVGGGYLCSL